MGNQKVTSIDVARLAGVSQATVSRTFSGDTTVTAKTRAKVMQAAEQLEYTPNAIARSLITQRTQIIGLVMAHLSSPFYPYVLEKFIQKFQTIGRQVLIFSAAANQEVDAVLPLALQYQVDALIITSATLSSDMVKECVRAGTPVILFNRYMLGQQVSAVCCDNVEGGRLVADLLLDAGHKRIAYIAGSENTSTNRDREKGFSDRLRERGQSLLLREQGHYTYELGYTAAERLLRRADPPDAIFCASDVMALGALDYAREQSLSVPDDLSIIGFDDIPMADWAAYSLTTVRQPIDQMIDTTVSLLQTQLDAPDSEPLVSLLPGKIIARRSARLPDVVQHSFRR